MKKRILSALAFLVIKTKKNIQYICHRNALKRNMLTKQNKKHYVLIKEFFRVYDHTLHPGRKHFCRYCLEAFSAEKTLKCHVKDSFEINSKQMIMTFKISEFVRLKNYERKIKSPL